LDLNGATGHHAIDNAAAMNSILLPSAGNPSFPGQVNPSRKPLKWKPEDLVWWYDTKKEFYYPAKIQSKGINSQLRLSCFGFHKTVLVPPNHIIAFVPNDGNYVNARKWNASRSNLTEHFRIEKILNEKPQLQDDQSKCPADRRTIQELIPILDVTVLARWSPSI
jgi:hypothetical protein